MSAGSLIELDEELAEKLGIRLYPGFDSPFTRNEAVGALANGTRVVKVLEDVSRDLHPVGTVGTIMGSLHLNSLGNAYFVAWDDRPTMPTFCVAGKIKSL